VDGEGFTQTPAVSGSFAFRASYGGDSVYNALDSGCEPLTVTKLDPTSVTTDIHDGAHNVVTTVPAKTVVHDSAVVSGSAGTPTGTVTFKWFTNDACSGSPAATSSALALSGGSVHATAFPQTAGTAGSFGFQARYNGDGVYNAKDSACEPLVVSKIAPTSVNTDIHKASHTVTTIVLAGTKVHDKATVSGSAGTPTGTVTFKWFTNGTCTEPAAATSAALALSSGSVDATGFVQAPGAAGNFAFRATYNGDSVYSALDSACELLVVVAEPVPAVCPEPVPLPPITTKVSGASGANVPGRLANLVTAGIVSPNPIRPCERISITVKTKNGGRGGAGPTKTRVYFTRDQKIDAGDVVVTTVDVPALDAGQEHSATIPFIVPAAFGVGKIFEAYVVDVNGEVAEDDETDNIRFRSIDVKAVEP
jgi:hypothetical protein